MRRFFFDKVKKTADIIQLSKDEANHIRTVLRLESGTIVELLDGEGTVYKGELICDGNSVSAKVVSHEEVKENKNTSLWLGQALLKGSKIDDILPKCTELGVDVFSVFQSYRCQGRLKGERAVKKKERWERIVEASCKQCMRPTRMQVEPVTDFTSLIQSLGQPAQDEIRIFFWEEESRLMLREVSFASSTKLVRILLGPEGGFTEEEAGLVQEHGWVSVSLGERILKADTATVATVSLVQYLAGNFG